MDRRCVSVIWLVILGFILTACEGGGDAFKMPQATSLLPPAKAAGPRGLQYDFQFSGPAQSASSAPDWNIPNGHFFTQTGGGKGLGYAVVDDEQAKFWSEFNRLGGVQAVGYPASQRFQWDGFTVQVFQRVIFQWHPETAQVAFVNVFDRLHDLGKDDFLSQTKSIPPPKAWNETGQAWGTIVQNRLATLDTHPAIKKAYQAAVGDPVQANGLPTSDVVDEGAFYALRAQRVVFQEWKQDEPWAKKGEVTVALGGDIAKEAGILPDPSALQPTLAPNVQSVLGAVAFAQHSDEEKQFNYPAGWTAVTVMRDNMAHNYYQSPSGAASIYYLAKYGMGPNFKLPDFISGFVKALVAQGNFYPEKQEVTQINGHPAILQWYSTTGDRPTKGIAMVIQAGDNVYYMGAMSDPDVWSSYEPILLQCLQSYQVVSRQ
ncbi:MAG TPA: hypothetical protein VKX96_07710 [Chloroflexota bacterium]|jgi:hypothetical protein|nr:hypothetical protein [Chloroflexota bacterium]